MTNRYWYKIVLIENSANQGIRDYQSIMNWKKQPPVNTIHLVKSYNMHNIYYIVIPPIRVYYKCSYLHGYIEMESCNDKNIPCAIPPSPSTSAFESRAATSDILIFWYLEKYCYQIWV